MKIGILGAGHIGGTLGRHLARAGHSCSSVRHPDELQDLLREVSSGTQRGTLEEAARFGEVVILGPLAEEGRPAATRPVQGKVVIDAMNPYSALLLGHGPSFRPMDLGESTSSEVAKLLPGARLVKAFNTMSFADLQSGAFKSWNNTVADTTRAAAAPWARKSTSSRSQVPNKRTLLFRFYVALL